MEAEDDQGRGGQVGVRRHPGRYLQRSGVRVQRGRLRHHGREDDPVAELHQAEPAGAEAAELSVQAGDDGRVEGEGHHEGGV